MDVENEDHGEHQERRRALLGGRGPGWVGTVAMVVLASTAALGVAWFLQEPGVPAAALEELQAAQSATEARLGEFVAQWTEARDELDSLQTQRETLSKALEDRDGDVATLRAQVEQLEARIEKQLSDMKRLRASAKAAVASAPPPSEPDAEAQRRAALLALGLEEGGEEASTTSKRPGPPSATIRQRKSP